MRFFEQQAQTNENYKIFMLNEHEILRITGTKYESTVYLPFFDYRFHCYFGQ